MAFEPTDLDISPAEIMQTLINDNADEFGLAPAVVGPANDTQQQAGVVQIVDAGLPQIETYRRVVWVRTQLRCLSGSLSEADVIGRRLQFFLNGQFRTQARQPSNGQTYLIHLITVTAGPSNHYDTPETWEVLLFTETLMGLDPIV